MDLLVIRHGQSEADILNVMEGRADFELTDLGKKQAAVMADWVKSRYDVSKIVASPLKRAAQTAGYLAHAFDIGVEYDDDLMEFQNGLLAGLPYEEANARYPRPETVYPHTALYGMESALQFRMRAETALSRLLYENPPDATIAVVAHGGIIHMLFRSFLDLPVSAEVSLSTGDTGIHHWRAQGSARKILLSNSQAHLDALYLTSAS